MSATALQDSLQHADIPAQTEETAAEEEVVTASPRAWRVRTEKPDTAPPDPHQMKPLPADLPFTGQPDFMQADYWAHGLLRFEKPQLVRQLDSLAGRSSETLSLETRGMAGDPLPYRFRTDDIVTSTLLVSFFLMVWVIARSRHYLAAQVRDFFHTTRTRENLFAERTEAELRGQIFLLVQTCFVLGILFFDYTQQWQTEVFNQVSPYKILGVSTGLCLLYYFAKIACYSAVNAVFFPPAECRRWNETYLMSVLAEGLGLLPVALLVVYFNLPFATMQLLAFIVLIAVKLLLLYKCHSIFFRYTAGGLHLILYLCTLEIAPLFVLFRALVYANNYLLTIN